MVNVPQVQIPDFGASIMRGEQVQQSRLQAMAARQAMDDSANARRVAAEELPRIGTLQGPELVSALGRLAGADPRYAQFAFPLIQRARDDAELGVGGAAPAAAPVAMPAAGGAPTGIRTGAAIPVPTELDDADVLARTIIGEAGNQGEEGQRAVAAVIRNRMNQTGRGVRDVVLAPSQFEPWGARREELLRIPTTDPRYIAARRLAEETIAGRIEDPTRGATHFLNPDLQRSLGRQQPSWAPEGQGQRIGAHVFYAPGGGVRVGQTAGAPAQTAAPVARDPNVTPASGGDTIPAQTASPGGVFTPPGYDAAAMARVAAARRASPNNATAQAILQRYDRDVQTALATRRGEAPPLETVEGPDGRPVLVPREQAVGRTPVRVPSTVVNNNPGETSFDRERGKTLAERASDWEAASTRSAQTLGRLQRFEALNQQFTTGAGANISLTAGQVAQRLGIPDAVLGTLGIARDQVAAGEGLRSLTSQMLVGLLGSGGFPSNNFSNADRDMLERALPALANSPNGNAVIINILRASAERDRTIGAAWREWTAQNGESAESVRRFQTDRLPALTGQDILTPILQDAVPADNPTTPGPGGRGTAAPPPAAPAARPRARNAQGQTLEYNGTAWVPVQ